MKNPVIILAALAALLAAPAARPAPPPLPEGTQFSWVEDADPAVAEIRALGDRMIDRIGGALISEVRRVMATQGLEEATEALHLKTLEPPAAAPGRPRVTAIRRTSLRIRDPNNAPDAADLAALTFIRQELSDGNNPPRLLLQRVAVPGQPVEYRLYKPIAVLPECLHCHGAADSQLPGVRDSLQRHYPEDKAVEYQAGDWRGFIRLSVLPPDPAPPTPAAPAK